MNDIEDLFKPTSATIRQLLRDQVGGFCIPSYQRPYRWAPADLRRLCEDLIEGLERLADDPEAVTFIGAIITVSGSGSDHDTNPSDPKLVIDGQQRLTTVLMMCVALHERLSTLEVKCRTDQEADTPELSKIDEQTKETLGNLLDCLSLM